MLYRTHKCSCLQISWHTDLIKSICRPSSKGTLNYVTLHGTFLLSMEVDSTSFLSLFGVTLDNRPNFVLLTAIQNAQHNATSQLSGQHRCFVSGGPRLKYRPQNRLSSNSFLSPLKHFQYVTLNIPRELTYTSVKTYYRKLRFSGQHSCFVFWRSWVHISVRRSTAERVLVVLLSHTRRILRLYLKFG